MFIRSLCALAIALSFVGCSDSDDPGDTGVHSDAAAPDAATPDAAAPDAATPDAAAPDAGTADSGDVDAGEEIDAGAPPDSGIMPDSGCELGQISSTATTTNLDLFGTPAYFNQGQPLPAGTYRVTYVDGCMKYGGGQGWTVNAYAANSSCWYIVGATTNDRIVVPPGTVGFAVGAGAYADFEDCVTASLLVPPVEFTVAQPTPLGVWLLDSPYSDNLAGVDNRNPTWALSVVTSSCSN